MRRNAIPLALVALLVGCAPSRSVLVQLVSNMAPGREVDSASVSMTVGGGGDLATTVPIEATASLGRPTRLAIFTGLAGGRYDITVTLRHGSSVVQTRRVVRDIDGASVVTVLMTRECNGVMCPGAGDPSAEACLGGRCVQPGCDEEHPELCTMPQCRADADCAGMASTVACAPQRCSASGTCFSRPDDALCASGQFCDSTLGCVAAGSDAGTSDDAGDDGGLDGGRDAALDASGCAIGAHFVGGACHDFLDVNRDGIGDLIVGASSESSSSGAAYLYRGSATGPVLVGAFRTGGSGERIGMAVASVHDANGDGFDDVLVSGHNIAPGHAYLILGGAALPSTLVSAVALSAPAPATEFGQFMAGVGDVNGDGLADAVVAEDVRAVAHLFYGHAGTGYAASPDVDTQAPDLFGAFAPGDLDGDGAGDLVLPGLMPSSDHVHVYLARGGAFSMSTPTATLTCPDGADHGFGALASADVNGDGRMDLVIGASAYSPAGRLFLYLGRAGVAPTLSSMMTFVSEVGLGAALTSLGDIDGDGSDDLAIASDVTGSAAVTIFRGSASGGLTRGTPFLLPMATGRTRVALDAADLNGDGHVDLVVGDPILGHVYVVAGPLTAPSLTTTYDLTQVAGTNFGGAIASH